MKPILTALQFLTILPLRTASAPSERDFAGAISAFPLAGLFIGGALVLVNTALSPLFGALAVNAITVLALTVFTGGLHLDGLADTVDGMCGGKDRERVLEIMRDSRIGAMGTLSMVFSVLMKIMLLNEIPGRPMAAALLLMPVCSRWSMVPAMYLFKYARTEGKAGIFFRNTGIKQVLISAVLAAAPAIWLLKSRGMILMAVTVAAALLAGRFISSRIGGLTGDGLGAVNEIGEMAFLATYAILL